MYDFQKQLKFDSIGKILTAFYKLLKILRNIGLGIVTADFSGKNLVT